MLTIQYTGIQLFGLQKSLRKTEHRSQTTWCSSPQLLELKLAINLSFTLNCRLSHPVTH